MEDELVAKEQSFTGNSLDSPSENRLNIKQDAGLSEQDESIVGQSDPYEDLAATTEIQEAAAGTGDIESVEESVEETVDAKSDEAESVSSEEVSENDIIEIFAENGSWMEVRDANNSRLFYNMVPVGGSKVLVGKAPFSITMGNAKTTRVVINELEVDMTDYIRPNNTAIFSVSTNGQNIIFH